MVDTDDAGIALGKKFAKLYDTDRKILETIRRRMDEDPNFKATMNQIHTDWVNTLREKKRTLVKTIPWTETTAGELGVNIPDMEVEVDGDAQVVRVYKLS